MTGEVCKWEWEWKQTFAAGGQAGSRLEFGNESRIRSGSGNGMDIVLVELSG